MTAAPQWKSELALLNPPALTQTLTSAGDVGDSEKQLGTEYLTGSAWQPQIPPKWGQHRYRDAVPSRFTDVARFSRRAFLEQRCPFRTYTHHL